MSSLSASYCPTVHSFAGAAAADSTTKTRATKRLLICPLAPCELDKPSNRGLSQHRGSSKVGQNPTRRAWPSRRRGVILLDAGGDSSEGGEGVRLKRSYSAPKTPTEGRTRPKAS